jgi:hypothetical protein
LQDDLHAFTRRIIAFRDAHPVFRRASFFAGEAGPDSLPDVYWFRPDGRRMTRRAWDSTAGQIGVFLNGKAIPDRTASGSPVEDDSFLVIFNTHHEDAASSYRRGDSLEHGRSNSRRSTTALRPKAASAKPEPCSNHNPAHLSYSAPPDGATGNVSKAEAWRTVSRHPGVAQPAVAIGRVGDGKQVAPTASAARMIVVDRMARGERSGVTARAAVSRTS